MSENVQKYENWRAITESDYVTMFIKTWFAFVATLRDLYPKENLEDIIGKGDKLFLSPYLKDFDKCYSSYHNIDSIIDNILCVYKSGREFVLKNKKYSRFFSEDFYEINNTFTYKKNSDEYSCIIKKVEGYVLDIRVVYLNKKYFVEGKPLAVNVNVDFADLINRSLTDMERDRYLKDEAAYINDFAEEMKNRVSKNYISKFLSKDYKSVFPKKIYSSLEALTSQEINNVLVSAITPMQDYGSPKEEMLYTQVPFPSFIYSVEDGKPTEKVDTYLWFLNFVYFLRNALFHEIIDPLDGFWQDMFKCAYLALKEVLDGNIRFFIDREAITSSIVDNVMSFISDNEEEFLPGLIDGSDIEAPDVQVTKYIASDDGIEVEFVVLIDYWASMYTVNQTKIVGKAKYIGEGKNIETKDINFSIDSINKVKEI